MSGGHYDYLYSKIEYTYEGELENLVLEKLLKDFCQLLRSLEWYKSGDTCREDYHEDVNKFIKKWLKSDETKELIKTSNIISRFEDLIEELKQTS